MKTYLFAVAALFVTASISNAADSIHVSLIHIAHPTGGKPRTIAKPTVITASGQLATIQSGKDCYAITPTLNPDHTLTVKLAYSIRQAGSVNEKIVTSPRLVVKLGQRATVQSDEQEFQVIASLAK